MGGADDFMMNFVLRARDEASAVMQSFGGGIESMAGAAKLAIAGMGIAAIGASVEAVKMAEEFDKDLRKVDALTGASAEQMKLYHDRVLDLMTIVPKSADDLAKGLYYVVSAGFDGADAMNILKMGAEAATAGLTDTKTVVDATTSVLNAYHLSGKDAGHVTDVLTEAVRQGKTEFGDLAGSLGRVLPVASAMGVNFEEVAANMSTLTRVGLSSDQAATSLLGTLTAMLHPSSAAAKEAEQLGFSFGQMRDELKSKGLLVVMQELMDKTGGNVEVLGKLFPNVRALKDVLATAGDQGDKYAGVLDAMTHSAGLTDQAFQKTVEGLGPQFEILKNNISAILIPLGEMILPKLVDITKGVIGFVKDVQGVFAKGGGFDTAWKAAGEAVDVLTGRAPDAGAAMRKLIGDQGAEAVMHALALLRDSFDAVSAKVREVVDAVVAYIKPFVDTALLTLSRFWTEIQPKLAKAWDSIVEKVQWVVDHILKPILEGLATFWKEHWDAIEMVLRDVWGVITGVIRVAWDLISGLFKTFLDLISGNWEGAWNDMSQAVRNIIDVDLPIIFGHLLDLVSTLGKLARDLGEAIIKGIAQGLDNLKTWLWNKLLESLSGMLDAAKKFLHISSPSQVFAEPGEAMVRGLAVASRSVVVAPALLE